MNCSHHAFVSHYWETGQAQTHAIVRKLQLLLPGIKLWLDVDNLDNIGDLEINVGESNVFIIYYSDGYFTSQNCKRELFAAMKERKPVIVIYKVDNLDGPFVVKKIKEKCLFLSTPRGQRSVSPSP